jgi:hypothetical protein
MQFQLILQFRGAARQKFDQLRDPAALLAETLGDTAQLDGEDVGPHGANVFLFTDTPADTLDRAMELFPDAKLTEGFAAAYRQISREDFRILWPADATAEFHLR